MVFPRVLMQGGEYFSLYTHLVDRLLAIGYSSVQMSRYGRPAAIVQREIIELEYKS